MTLDVPAAFRSKKFYYANAGAISFLWLVRNGYSFNEALVVASLAAVLVIAQGIADVGKELKAPDSKDRG